MTGFEFIPELGIMGPSLGRRRTAAFTSGGGSPGFLPEGGVVLGVPKALEVELSPPGLEGEPNPPGLVVEPNPPVPPVVPANWVFGSFGFGGFSTSESVSIPAALT